MTYKACVHGALVGNAMTWAMALLNPKYESVKVLLLFGGLIVWFPILFAKFFGDRVDPKGTTVELAARDVQKKLDSLPEVPQEPLIKPPIQRPRPVHHRRQQS